jgi:hypothetical protein
MVEPARLRGHTARCEVVPIPKGGYHFFPPWEVTSGSTARLHVGNETGYVPLRYHTKWSFQFGPSPDAGLHTFLAYLRSRSLWRTATRTSITCRIVVGANPRTEQAATIELVPPVAPYMGSLGTAGLSALGSNEPIRYVGTGKGEFIGRFLHKPIDSMYFFKHGGKLETDPAKRGFDCITYVGSVFGAQSQMTTSGELAKHLQTQAVDGVPNDSPPATIYRYFSSTGSKKEAYLLWSGGHIVIVHENMVHEFQAPPPYGQGKYVMTPVLGWLSETKRNSKKFNLAKGPRMQS